MSLDAIRHFHVPKKIVDETDKALRSAGKKQLEAFVFWSGVVDGADFRIRSSYFPEQTGYRLPDGVCVRVDGKELHQLNLMLYQKKEILAVQIHTHPGRAYHSETDDTYPIVTLQGGLSIVVPNFCLTGVAGPATATYRLSQAAKWSLVPSASSGVLLAFEP